MNHPASMCQLLRIYHRIKKPCTAAIYPLHTWVVPGKLRTAEVEQLQAGPLVEHFAGSAEPDSMPDACAAVVGHEVGLGFMPQGPSTCTSCMESQTSHRATVADTSSILTSDWHWK